MSEKFLYYIGAGASAQALPTVKDSSDGSIKGLASAFKEMANDIEFNSEISLDYQEFLNEFVKDLKWLAQESVNFGTIDTYAKYLYLKDRKKLDRLKQVVSLYFSIEQLVNKKEDRRYIIWITSILNTAIFPDNIKIITWNYDFQFEMAAENFRNEEFYYGQGASVHSPPLIGYFPPVGNTFPQSTSQYDASEISLLHLNGIAGFYLNKVNQLNENLFLNNEGGRDFVLGRFVKQLEQKHHLLTFAWEKSSEIARHMARRIEFAEHISSETSILIVIGYSFPFFNREIDKRIFEKLKSSGKLKKIYFQDPYLDGSFLKNQFDLGDIDIVHISKADTFFIPNEL